MIRISTRENSKGNWWCNATIGGYDYSFISGCISTAQNQMKDLLKRKGIELSETIWYDAKYYPKQEKQLEEPRITYSLYRIDRGMV